MTETSSLPQPATRRKGRPAKGRSSDLTERIVETAAKGFLSDGFEATSMETIASVAGISKRTLYARFRSKPLLLQAVADRLFHETRSEFLRYRERTDAVDAVLREMAHHMHRRLLMPFSIDVYRLLVAQSQRQRNDVGLLLGGDRYLLTLVTVLTEQFQRGLDGNEIVSDWDASLLAEQFLEAICAWDLRRLVFGYEMDRDSAIHSRRVDQRFDLFWRAIRPAAAALSGEDGVSRDALTNPSGAEAPLPARDRTRPPRCMSGSRRSY